MTEPLSKLQITTEFLKSLNDRQFTDQDKSRFIKALVLLESDERHPSLRVHALSGELAGYWSASASDSLRIEFRRLPDGRKLLVRCSKHYDR